jgi:cell division protein FtsL
MSITSFYSGLTVKERFFLSLLIVTIILSSIFMLQSYSTNRRLKKLYESEIEKTKKKYLEEIRQKEENIKNLLNDNKKQDRMIEQANKSIDSLQKVKSRVEIKYKWKYKEIELYNTEQIKNYWKNEFKD